MGLDNIVLNNGWSQAFVGASIVMTGLVILSIAISQIHKLVEFWENRSQKTAPEPKTPSLGTATTVDHVTLDVPLQCPADINQTAALYKPLGRAGLDAFVQQLRGRFGSRLIVARTALPQLLQFARTPGVIALVADQVPRPDDEQYWGVLLGRDVVAEGNWAGARDAGLAAVLAFGAALLKLGLAFPVLAFPAALMGGGRDDLEEDRRAKVRFARNLQAGGAEKLLDVVFSHPIGLIANALGVPVIVTEPVALPSIVAEPEPGVTASVPFDTPSVTVSSSPVSSSETLRPVVSAAVSSVAVTAAPGTVSSGLVVVSASASIVTAES